MELFLSRKRAFLVLTPLNPTFIQENWGLQGVHYFFLFLLRNIDCGYSLEPPRRNMKNFSFLPENLQFLETKFSIYLYRRVLVMTSITAMFSTYFITLQWRGIIPCLRCFNLLLQLCGHTQQMILDDSYVSSCSPRK